MRPLLMWPRRHDRRTSVSVSTIAGTRLLAAVLSSTLACSAGLTDVPDPSTILDPSTVQSNTGAVGLYKGATSAFDMVFAGGNGFGAGASFAFAGGLASDEYGTSTNGGAQAYNLRVVDIGNPLGLNVAVPYQSLHQARLYINQAVGTIRQYSTNIPSSYLAQLYDYKGYLYIMFAEMYCSGIPFSEVVYNGDLTFGMPESTEQMLQDAITQFDSAAAVTTDSTRFTQLAAVGKARALLDLGKFSDAAAAVPASKVPTTFTYSSTYSATYPNYMYYAVSPNAFFVTESMANFAGTNGLGYVTAGTAGPGQDPRVTWVNSAGFSSPGPIPAKFATATAPVPLGSGIEARLIEAEAALQAHDVTTWANILNTLRQTAITPAIPALTADSTTTASDSLRVNVMFRERAFWLFGTGHRMGDMRRLIRQYGRLEENVFPTGLQPQLPSPNNTYSNETNFSPPLTEVQNNSNFPGCANRDA